MLPLLTSAASFDVGEFVEHKGAPISEDLYLAGGTVDVSGNVLGDAVLAGGEVSTTGDVDGDLLIAGGAVDIVGGVTDDVRAAGGEIIYSGETRDDFIAAAGYVRFSGDAAVGGDAVMFAGVVIANGTISGDLTVYGGEVILNGIVNGNVDLRYTETVTIGEDAVIGGDFTYASYEEVEIPESALIGGEITRVESEAMGDSGTVVGFISSALIFKIVTMLIAALLAVFLFRKFSQNIGEDGYKHFWKNLAVGFVTMVVTPILAVILMISFAGLFTGVVVFAIGTTLLLVAKVYAGILLGALLSKWFMKKVIVDWKWTIIGVVLLQLVVLIPIVGMLFAIIIGIASFGTILVQLHQKMWQSR